MSKTINQKSGWLLWFDLQCCSKLLHFAGVSDNLPSVKSSREVSQSPVFVSSSVSSTALGVKSEALLPSSSPSVSSLQPSTKTPSISLSPSLSFPSPQPHQTKFVSTTFLPTLATSRTMHVEPSVMSTAIQGPITSLKPSKVYASLVTNYNN